MWLDIFIIFLITAALGGLFFIIIKHWRQLTALDVEQLPGTQPARLKQSILEQRLQRQLQALGGPAAIKIKTIFNNIYKVIHNWAEKIINLEESYRRRLFNRPLSDVLSSQQQRQALLSEAESLMENEKYTEAEKVYLQVLQIESDCLEAYEGLGNLYYRQKNYQEASQTFEHLIKLHGGSEAGYSGLGLVALERGDLRSAAAAYEQSLKINPRSAGIYFNLAKVYESMEDFPKALKQIRAALNIEPDNPRYLDYGVFLAITYHDLPSAEELLARLLQTNPENQKIVQYRQELDSLRVGPT